MRDGTHGARGIEERGETKRCAGAEAWTRLQSHPGSRNHAQDSFRADEHAVGTRPGTRSGKSARLQHANWRHDAQAFDEIVDMSMKTGKMAARSGRNPAAKRRKFKTLREVPQRKAMRLELIFQGRTIGAGFDRCSARYRVHFDDLGKIAQIEGDGSLMLDAVNTRLDAAADARAASKRRQRSADGACPVHHGRNLRLVARIGHNVGRTIVIAKHGSDVIRVGLAVGVRGAIVAFGRAKGGERGRRCHARFPQGEIVKARDSDRVEFVSRKFRLVAAEHKLPLLRAHAFAFAPPAVMFQPCASHERSSCLVSSVSSKDENILNDSAAPERSVVCRQRLTRGNLGSMSPFVRLPAVNDLSIRTMRPDEISIAVNWAAAEGWNPGLAEAACFVAVDPEGFLIGELDGAPAATVSCANYSASFAFLGFYIVREDLRGRGYGLRIWDAAIAHAGPRVIGLDGVVAQQQNYRKSGFELAYPHAYIAPRRRACCSVQLPNASAHPE